MVKGKTREESIKLTAKAYGISEIDAAEIVDISTGESQGDVIEATNKTEAEAVSTYLRIKRPKDA